MRVGKARCAGRARPAHTCAHYPCGALVYGTIVILGALLFRPVAIGAEATKPEYGCQAGAEATAANLRALQGA